MKPPLKQETRYCTAAAGTSIAYATIGKGPPLVRAAHWMTHLEFDWNSPIYKHVLEDLAAGQQLIRYDERGNGLSDRDVAEMTFESWVLDLEAVVDAAGVERFGLLGISQGGAVAIEYSIRHPERVSHLILYGAYALGAYTRNPSPENRERRQALITLTRHGWGKDDPTFRQVWTSLFIPEGTREQWEWFNELQRASVSPENAVRILELTSHIDVVDRLPQVSVPTLVLHCDEELVVPFRMGKQLAAEIPGARFVPLRGKNHLILEHEPAWQVFLSEVREFLGTELPSEPADPADVSTAAVAPSAGELLAQYKIVGKIGAGGMGEIFLAEDTTLERRVALKFLPADMDDHKDARQRFVREAKAAAALDHPFVCKIYETGKVDDRCFIAMEYVDGVTLQQKLRESPLPLKEALRTAIEMAEALEAAHGRGIIHRDLKPANIMLTSDGHVKVLDFGVAKRISDSADSVTTQLTREEATIGTLAYMSPEQLRGQPLDTRSDIFSFGILLYEMMTGTHPFEGTTDIETAGAILNESPPPLTEHLGEVPGPLQETIGKLLAKDVDERYEHIRDVRSDLERVASLV